jgi:5-formyltetrahydrofolate cyclo-ligase
MAAAKQAIRERVWDRLETEGLARFPFPPHGRITNFEDAAAAAERALSLPELPTTDGAAVKANPDAPQLPLRRGLLRRGTTVYMAVPRLRDPAPFVELDPAVVTDLEAAPTVSKMDRYGTQVHADAVPTLDAIVVGSVAVTHDGVRIGKGEGYSDLEFAVLAELGLADADTPVITTIHDEQLIEEDLDAERHDVPVDVICTPTQTIRTTPAVEKPTRLFWDSLEAKQVESMPVLERLQSHRDGA